MPEVDEGFEPVPALTEPPDAAEELTLQDALADPAAFSADASQEPVPLGRAPAYDFVNHRLVPGLAGGPLMTRGTGTLATWIEKCIRTRRGENPAVDPDFGCDLLIEDILSEGVAFDSSAISELTSAWSRGLSTHPRIASIEDIDVQGSIADDAVYVTFHVTVDGDEDDFDFSTTIGA